MCIVTAKDSSIYFEKLPKNKYDFKLCNGCDEFTHTVYQKDVAGPDEWPVQFCQKCMSNIFECGTDGNIVGDAIIITY